MPGLPTKKPETVLAEDLTYIITSVIEGRSAHNEALVLMYKIRAFVEEKQNMPVIKSTQTSELSEDDVKAAIQQWLVQRFPDAKTLFKVELSVQHYTEGIRETPATKVRVIATREL